MRFYLLFICALPGFCYAQKSNEALTASALNQLAENYVRLGLAIGQYDTDFVDAYYGPEFLRPTSVKLNSFPKDSFLRQTKYLQSKLARFITRSKSPGLQRRARWMDAQLIAFGRRIKMFSGEAAPFNLQAKELFGVEPPTFEEEHFAKLLNKLNDLLPGKGSVNDRFNRVANRFIVPKDKLDTVIKLTIAESARRTKQHYALPPTENFRLEYVTGKSWSGYNWYAGKYQSLIQINTDITAMIDRVIDIASHEGYPGHHVYNMLLEKNLYSDSGWVEISLYPLFSPQSLIAEGSGNYGIEMAFPGNEKIDFIKKTLAPLAGMDTTGLTMYFQALSIKGKLMHVRTEVARRVINGNMNDAEAIHWLMRYGLFNESDANRSLKFTKTYQSYVMNYTFGYDLVKNYVETKAAGNKNSKKRWQHFNTLLTNQVMTSDLLLKKNQQ